MSWSLIKTKRFHITKSKTEYTMVLTVLFLGIECSGHDDRFHRTAAAGENVEDCMERSTSWWLECRVWSKWSFMICVDVFVLHPFVPRCVPTRCQSLSQMNARRGARQQDDELKKKGETGKKNTFVSLLVSLRTTTVPSCSCGR